MVQRKKLTRAQLREQRRPPPAAGAHGVEADDFDADCFKSQFIFYASSPQEAKARVTSLGVHGRNIYRLLLPDQDLPVEVLASVLTDRNAYFRSQLNTSGWSSWEKLPDTFVYKTAR